MSTTPAIVSALVSAGIPAGHAVDLGNQLVTSPDGVNLQVAGLPITGGTSGLSLVAGSLAAATANRVAIQAALNAGGTVSVSTPGVIFIDQTLLIGDFTTLVLSPNTVLSCNSASGYVFPILKNVCCSSQAVAVGSYSYASGAHAGVVTVNFTGNLPAVLINGVSTPLAAGMGLLIKGDTSGYYSGIWPVLSVNGLSATFEVGGNNGVPPAPAGTWIGACANLDITITGGLYTQNANNLSGNANYLDHCILIDKVRNPKFQSVRFKDNLKYCVYLSNTQNPLVDEMWADTGSDGVKLHGPTFGTAKISRIGGSYGDDVFSAQTIANAPYVATMVPSPAPDTPGGSLNKVTVTDISVAGSTANVVALYVNGGNSSGGQGWFIDEVEVARIRSESTGTVFEAVTEANGIIGRLRTLRINDVFGPGQAPGGAIIGITGIGGVLNIGKMTIDGVTNGVQVNGSVVYGTNGIGMSNVVFGSAAFKNINFYASANTAGQHGYAVATTGAVTVDQLSFADSICQTSAGNSGCALFAPLGNLTTTGVVSFVNCEVKGWASLLGESSNNTAYSMQNCFCNGGLALGTFSSGTNSIYLEGCKSVGAQQAPLMLYGGSDMNISCTIVGCKADGAFLNTGGSSTGVISWNNPDGSAPIDLSKIQRTAGSIVKTSVGNGSIVANNMAVCDATGAANSWKQLSNTSLTY